TDLPITWPTRLHQQSNKWHGYLTVSPHRLDHISGPTHAHRTSNPKATRTCLWVVSINALPRARIYGYQNINWLSIDYACRPRPMSRLTLGRPTLPMNPYSSGWSDSHCPIRSSCFHSHSQTVLNALQYCFEPYTTRPYPNIINICRGFGGVLE